MQPTPDLAALLAAVALPFVAALLTPLCYRVAGEQTAYVGAAVALASFLLVVGQAGTRGSVAAAWIPALGVSVRFYVDGLALLVAGLASGFGVLVFVYSGGYMHDEPGQARYYAALLAFMGSMLGVALVADLVALFVFWELTSLSSFVLIGHYHREARSRYAARKSMLLTVGGGLFMLAGFLALVVAAKGALGAPSTNLVAMLHHPEAMRTALRSRGWFVPALLLIGVGAAAKSAQVPLHVWLPDAMEAPTPVSAFLHSATMVKAGVYLVGRFRPLLTSAEWTQVFVALGLTTMAVTAVLAVAATDVKELLAYSTASHLGLIVAGFGYTSAAGEEAAVAGAEAGAFHVLAHASFKAALFMVAGVVAHQAGSRRLEDLRGLGRHLPVTAAVAAVAGLSMAGVPPMAGFYSKELLFEATWAAATHEGGLAWLAPAVAVIGSVFTVLYSVRFLAMFVGSTPDALGAIQRPSVPMLAPPVVLAALVAAASVAPRVAVDLVAGPALAGVVAHGGGHAFAPSLPTHVTPPVLMSATALAGGLALAPVAGRVSRTLRAGLRAARPLRADWWYDAAVAGLTTLSVAAEPRVQTGRLRTYATWLFGSVAALALGGYVAAGALALPAPGPVLAGLPTAPLVVVLLVAVVAGVAVARAPSHVAGVLTLSILGFTVAVFYVLASAPDLALTQLVVETLALLIFLLVLDKLPTVYRERHRFRAARDAALSLAVGVTVTVSVVLATANRPDAIASYFVRNAVPKGGGGNVVNVILVDFRAFDTMGEISVVAMAGLSVLTLIGLQTGGGE